MQILTSIDFQAYLDQHALPGEILHLSVPTPTVETAAAAVGCQPEQIVKSILFLVDDQPALAVTCGMATIERRAIAAHYGVGRKRVKLASPEEVIAIAGYAVGAMTPFGHRKPLPTLLDPRVLDQAEVFAGGGDENALVRLNPQDILRASNAVVLSLTSFPSIIV